MSETEAKAGLATPFPLDQWAIAALFSVRERLFGAIRDALEDDGHCKSFEGGFGIQFPNYFQDTDPAAADAWAVTLDCYIIGPNRHYAWRGATLWDAVHKCEKEVDGWVSCFYEDADRRRPPKEPSK